MCIIIDSNRINDFFNHPSREDIKPIHEWIKRVGRIVYSTGDKFSTELQRKARKKLEEYSRSGKANLVPADLVVAEKEKLCASGLRFSSDDQHVLALARITNVRLLYSSDEGLHEDFKDPLIINKPRGKVYTGAKQRHLLTPKVCAKLFD